ncbi:hypothetical protein KSP40_PGU006780 [Platanthera guangdongensis]|uniref:Uncharacterized protein n=1 Tax=Platanthera guangdongensis TaxID=2320717 RepID=A0ABR2MW57_9ASPA
MWTGLANRQGFSGFRRRSLVDDADTGDTGEAGDAGSGSTMPTQGFSGLTMRASPTTLLRAELQRYEIVNGLIEAEGVVDDSVEISGDSRGFEFLSLEWDEDAELSIRASSKYMAWITSLYDNFSPLY